ncbi:MAG: gluconate 2-dehydrogenase subunit 3 family protein [Dehalococcoidia bacterium]|nr:gluconate 2-dehydrogenase subunit 3 family protein [Dehalococcoidia bacterium]MCB9484507.1 gluconate 2-dehydrogenase subunit 3 family protein [Thermoflexaceae bacterium]
MNTNPLADMAFMRAFLDTVIPPGRDGRMPGAGTLGLEGGISTAVESDARSGSLVRAGLAALAEAAASTGEAGGFPALDPAHRAKVLDDVLAEHPMLVNAVARHLYLAYYQHPTVLVAIGEPARPPFPEGFTVEPTDPELLAKLVSRQK